MTITDYVPVPVRLDFDALAHGFSRAVNALDEAASAELDRTGIEPAVRELVRLRASQLNGCAYCVDMHARAARAAGVSSQRVDAVAVWLESGLFTTRERAALELSEQVTLMATSRVPEESLRGAVAAFGDEGAAALLSLIVTINAWNTIGVATRCWPTAVRHDS